MDNKNQTNTQIQKRIYRRVYKRIQIETNGKYKTRELLGCSRMQLRLHLESLWQKGMNWDNYGFYGWHIDHIRPISSFNLNKKSEAKKCFNYKNLQPLWARENLCKGKKILP